MCFGMVLNCARLAKFISNNKDVLKYRLEKNWISRFCSASSETIQMLKSGIQFKKNVNGHGINLHISKMFS